MAAALTFFRRRRLQNTALLLAACGLAWAIQHLSDITLQFTAIGTGLALLALCFGLAFFNARKKLPFLPLLRASTWTQIHLYAGWFSVFLFLLHLRGRWPDGPFEIALALVFCAVALSGVFGLVISRIVPERLRRNGENVLFERIPELRHQLLTEVEALVWKAVHETNSFTIAEFYTARLQAFFSGPRNLFDHLIDSESPLQKLLGEVQLMHRYAGEKERSILAEITECIVAKDNLDFQYVGQGLLKYWLFVHVPLTFSLLILGVIHGLLAFSFAGGIR